MEAREKTWARIQVFSNKRHKKIQLINISFATKSIMPLNPSDIVLKFTLQQIMLGG